MDVSTSVIIDLWEVIAENIPNSRKEELSTKLVSIFAKEGVEKSEFNAIMGEDDYIDSAIEHYFADEEEEDDWSSYGEEDYDE